MISIKVKNLVSLAVVGTIWNTSLFEPKRSRQMVSKSGFLERSQKFGSTIAAMKQSRFQILHGFRALQV